MNFNIIGIEDLTPIMEVGEFLGFQINENGKIIEFKEDNIFSISTTTGKILVNYKFKVQIFRALSLIVENNGHLNMTAQNKFDNLCYMEDESRNAVSNINHVKETILKLALMGYNSFMLYTEDTYEIEKYPFFGYMRGAYSKEELKEIDIYANSFGIEMIPCIQTLAHLITIFRWDEFNNIHDIKDILLADNDETFILIEEMIKTMRECFISTRINLGMDEAEMIGLGKYLKLHGYVNPLDIMLKHVNRVLELCKKYNFKAYMWSDMFFKIISKEDYHSNYVLDETTLQLPEDLTIMYWDYYATNKETYTNILRNHKKISDKVAFAGGAWIWSGYAPLISYSREINPLALEACEEENVKEVIVTAWGDDCAECSKEIALAILQQYAEFNYGNTDVAKRFNTCTKGHYEDFFALCEINFTPDNPSPGIMAGGIGKYLLYQDILLGLYDRHISHEYREHFENLAKKYKDLQAKNSYIHLFEEMEALANILALKSNIGNEIYKAYKEDNREELEQLKNKCLEISNLIAIYRDLIERRWRKDNKIFGFEVLDIRLNALIGRVNYAHNTISRYLNHSLDKIDELEIEKLSLEENDTKYKTKPLKIENRWNLMVTANRMDHF